MSTAHPMRPTSLNGLNILLVSSKYLPEYAGSGYRLHRTYSRVAPPLGWQWRVLCNSVEHQSASRPPGTNGDTTYPWEDVAVHRIVSTPFCGTGSTWFERLPMVQRLCHAVTTYAEAWRTWKWLNAAHASTPFHLVHVVGTSSSTAVAILWARRLDLPLVIELVNTGASPVQPLPGLSLLWRLSLQRRTRIITISEKLRQTCARLGLQTNVWSRPNPVDERRFFPATREERDELRVHYTPFTPQDRVIAWIANFIPGKNQIFLIDLLDTLPEEYKLVLAGPLVTDGRHGARNQAYFDAVLRRIEELGLQHRVLVRPEFVDAAEYMRLADVFAIPSLAEGLSTPMLEALSCGLPVVANADEPAFQQWIRSGKNGTLCHLNDLDAWQDALEYHASWTSERRRRFAMETHAQAATAVIDHQMIKLFQGLLQECGTVVDPGVDAG